MDLEPSASNASFTLPGRGRGRGHAR